MRGGHGKHGMSRTPEYSAWSQMHSRCSNPKATDYARYGGRGIKVCRRWQSFSAFFADMGQRPSRGHSLDRRDNDGNYEPGNCRWATRAEQTANRSCTQMLTLGSRTRHLNEWAADLGLRPISLYTRIRDGWPLEKALTTPRLQAHVRKRLGELGEEIVDEAME